LQLGRVDERHRVLLMAGRSLAAIAWRVTERANCGSGHRGRHGTGAATDPRAGPSISKVSCYSQAPGLDAPPRAARLSVTQGLTACGEACPGEPRPTPYPHAPDCAANAAAGRDEGHSMPRLNSVLSYRTAVGAAALTLAAAGGWLAH